MKLPRFFTSIVITVSLLSSPALADIKIGVAMSQFDDTWQTYLREAMVNKAKAMPDGVRLQFEDARADVIKQISQIEGFISQGVDAIIVCPVDTAATRKMTADATAAGIPLIYVNRQPDDKHLPEGVAIVVSNEREAGQLQMQYLAEKMNGAGKVVLLLGDLANNATANRTQGVKEILAKYPGITIEQEQTATWARDKGMNLVNDWLTQGREFDAVVSNNDEMAIGAAMALRQAGVAKGKVLIAGVDGTPDGLRAVKGGELSVSVYQDAQGQADGAIDVAVHMVKKEPYEVARIIPFRLITPENVDEFN